MTLKEVKEKAEKGESLPIRNDIKIAKQLCIIKWEYIVKNEGREQGLIDEYPTLTFYNSQCAYCQLFINQNLDADDKYQCNNCPLSIIKGDGLNCLLPNHPYKKWYKLQHKPQVHNEDRLNAAKEMLKLIKSIKV